MSDDPENPGGFKPIGPPNPHQPAPYAQPAPAQQTPAQQSPAQRPYAPEPSGFAAPLSAPPGGFGVNLPPGVSTDVYQAQEQATQGSGSNGAALVSLIFGVLALVFGWCCGVFSLVFGLVAIGSGVVVLTRGTEVRSSDRTMAIVGVVLGALSMLVWVLLLFLGLGMSLFSP